MLSGRLWETQSIRGGNLLEELSLLGVALVLIAALLTPDEQRASCVVPAAVSSTSSPGSGEWRDRPHLLDRFAATDRLYGNPGLETRGCGCGTC